MRYSRLALLAAFALICTAFRPSPAQAQCLDWKPGFNLPGISGLPNALAVFDDGTGPALYAGGDFHEAGNIVANYVAKWDGAAWSPLGSGLNGIVQALTVFDDGSGPALYTGGIFTTAGGSHSPCIAKWNGSSWSDVGGSLPTSSGGVLALAVFDDGTGPALYAAGDFQVLGPPSLSGIAKWDGSAWTPLASGIGGTGAARVNSMAVFDDGAGPALFVGGNFDLVGGVAANSIAKWDGANWIGFRPVIDGVIRALAAFDDGSGSALYAGGTFTAVDGVTMDGLSRWNGTSWSPLGSGLFVPGGGHPSVESLKVFDDGTGSALYVGGHFYLSGGFAQSIVRWDGSSWSTLGLGVDDSTVAWWETATATALEAFDDGSGPALFATGSFDSAGETTANHIAKWNGSSWSSTGAGGGFLGSGNAVIPFDESGGSVLYAGRRRTLSSGLRVADCAKWDGSSWSRVAGWISGDSQPPEVLALAVHDDGSGSALYTGGHFSTVDGLGANCIARWDGQSWSPLGAGMANTISWYSEVKALRAFDDGSGPALYAGGFFTMAGEAVANHIARWDGTSWSPLGTGVDGAVKALEVFDDGTGPALFVGGYFGSAGGVRADHIAKWNGVTWSSIGSGLNGSVLALAVVDLGSGPSLFAGGDFTNAGGVPARNVARWNGSAWSSVGTGAQVSTVYSLAGFEDGWGTALYAGGISGIEKWNGSNWSPLGSGVSGYVLSLAVADQDADGTDDLFVGGDFGSAGALASRGLAEWRGCAHHGSPVCFGDGNGAPCPCWNSGFPGSGCNNAVNSGGARLNGAGVPSIGSDTLELDCTNLRSNVLCLVFQGDQRVAPTIDGDGLRCAGGHLRRLYAHAANGSSLDVPPPGDPSLSARSAALGDPLTAGARRIYQVYYRDKSPTFCPNPPGNTWNVSSGFLVDWLP